VFVVLENKAIKRYIIIEEDNVNCHYMILKIFQEIEKYQFLLQIRAANN